MKYVNFDNAAIRLRHPQNPNASLLGYRFDEELKSTDNSFGFSIPVAESRMGNIDVVIFPDTVTVYWDGGYQDTHGEWFGKDVSFNRMTFDITEEPKYQVIEPDKTKMPNEGKTPADIYKEQLTPEEREEQEEWGYDHPLF